jgi:ABC-type Mn2+/Zn2+ transport system ATPase subunit
MTAAVRCEGLSCAYRRRPVLDGVSLELPAGEMAALVGPSGAGKTTLLRALVGQVRPLAGRVLVGGRPAGNRAVRIGYVPQVDAVDWTFPITVREVVLLGRATESGPWPWPRRRDRRECDALLERLGLGALGGRRIRELSGGQRQRAFLARALFRRPALLLLDEPTSGVDVATKREILNLLFELNAEGATVVLTTHDLNGVAAHLPHLVCLNRTVTAEGSPDEVLRPDVLHRTFGAEMIVLRHGGLLLTAEAPGHRLDHPHRVHDDAHPVAEALT